MWFYAALSFPVKIADLRAVGLSACVTCSLQYTLGPNNVIESPRLSLANKDVWTTGSRTSDLVDHRGPWSILRSSDFQQQNPTPGSTIQRQISAAEPLGRRTTPG